MVSVILSAVVAALLAAIVGVALVNAIFEIGKALGAPRFTKP